MYTHYCDFIQALLDFSIDIDVTLFDRVVTALYTGQGEEVRTSFVTKRSPVSMTSYRTASTSTAGLDTVPGKPRFMAACPKSFRGIRISSGESEAMESPSFRQHAF